MDGQRTAALADVDPASVPYFAIALLPGRGRRVAARTAAAGAPAAARSSSSAPGPAGRDWLTPQVAAVLAAADDLVGYGPYLARVPPNPRQARHASDNRVEADRAAHALDLAAAGRCVAVVSGGDPGVFAMAAAVLEVAAQEKYVDVPVRVLPGVTASSAVAAAVGAPLGHDYAVISLSDRLKPWEVVAERLVAAARADLAIAIYNPRSTARPWQLGRRPRPAAASTAPRTRRWCSAATSAARVSG